MLSGGKSIRLSSPPSTGSPSGVPGRQNHPGRGGREAEKLGATLRYRQRAIPHGLIIEPSIHG